MRALLFSDLHCSYKNLQNIEDFVSKKGNKIDCLVFAGDVVNMGEPVGFMKQFIDAIKRIDLPFIWVPGNNDFGRSYYKLQAKHPSLESRAVKCCGQTFTGVGGSPASWSGQYAGESMIDRKKIGGSIFVSHFPPPGVRTYYKYDDASINGHSEAKPKNPNATGSLSAESADRDDSKINELKTNSPRLSDAPLVHICGHLHHRWGISYLGTTKVVQLAALELGYYAIMDLETLKVEFKKV